MTVTKNRRLVVRLIILAMLFGIIIYFSRSLSVSGVTFSHKSGFYSEDFLLEISAPQGCTIHYTLDGSIPDADSPVYTQPLLITDATPNANIHSAVKEISAHESIIVPGYPVDKCTVIRAVAVNPTGVCGEVISHSYFVGITPQKYGQMNVLSVITDPYNLFDYKDGIYVMGQKYDEYLVNGDHSRARYYWDSNYNQRGKEWERPALLQFFDNDGQLLLEKNCGIRIRGQTSRAKVQKGFNLYARPEYDGTDNFGTDFFGSGHIPQSLSLMNGGNEPALQFQDYAMTELTKGLDFSTARYIPYVVFIDGEFWGFYWLAEKFDANYFAHYYDVKPENVVMIKGEQVEIGEDKDILLYNDMVDFISGSDMSVEENYLKACKMIDIDSFTDYFAAMIYVGRTHDWLNHNTALWRSRSVQNDDYGDGRWRWIVYDCNGFTMGIASPSAYDHDTIGYAYEKSSIFRSLWSNAEFRAKFMAKLDTLAEENFSASITTPFIKDFTLNMHNVMDRTWKRWYGVDNTKQEEFFTKLSAAEEFFEKRSATVDSWSIF